MPSPWINNNILPIILLIDTSGNGGAAAAELNEAVVELEEALAEFMKKQQFYRINLSVITYSTDSKILWNAVDIEDFYWTPINTGGLSELGSGLSKLPEVIRYIYGRGRTDCPVLNPIILFIAKNYPTDNYEKQLEILNKQEWFLTAQKIAFNYGGDLEATGVFEKIVGTAEAANIPVQELNSIVSMLETQICKYDYDDFPKDFLKVDPITELPEYQIILNGNQIEVKEQLSISRCMVSPCDLIDAKKIVFTICENDGNVKIINSEFSCYADLYIEASTSRTFSGFLYKKIQIISDNATEIEIDTNTEHSSISIKNNGYDIFVRVEFLPDTTMELVDNDRLIDECDRTILCIKKIDYEEPVIINEPLMGDIEWDDDKVSTESAEPNGDWDDEW